MSFNEPGNPNIALTPLLKRPSYFQQRFRRACQQDIAPDRLLRTKAANDENDEEWRY
jgi:hypothetical protein